MKKKSFAIIGGGLTGCASALYLRNKGHNVTIFEKEKNLGGVAKDLTFDNKNIKWTKLFGSKFTIN